MNLHQIAAPVISAVNPMTLVQARISIGSAITGPSGKRPPLYATPGAFTASIAGTVLTISAVGAGLPQAGQLLAGAGLTQGTTITGVISADPNTGLGTYNLNRDYTGNPISSESMTTTMSLLAQVQPLSSRDLRQIEGLNLGGEIRKIYISGDLNGVIRPQLKNGDLITTPDGQVWLVNQSLESFAQTSGWTSAVMTLQNRS